MTRRSVGARARNAGGDAGETLVEILVTVSIMGIISVGLFGTIRSAMSLSGSQRSIANAGVALSQGAEAVRAASPEPCGSALATAKANYQTKLDNDTSVILPAGWAKSNLAVTGWSCDTSAAALNLQTITVTATPPVFGSCTTTSPCAESVDVVKRSPTP